MERLKALFENYYKEPVDRIETIKGNGSNRKVYRLLNSNRSVIGVVGDHAPENAAFIEFSRHFRSYGLPVPEVYVVDHNEGIYLEEDLGRQTLFEWMSVLRTGDEFPEILIKIYKKVLSVLPHFQISAGQSLDFTYCYQHDEFAHDSMNWDLQYFKHRFLEPFHKKKIDTRALGKDFQHLINFLLEEPREFFLYRDFQSRNVMIKKEDPHFIDYQSGRKGALQYDVASLLYDAKANIPEAIRETLLDEYLKKVRNIYQVDCQRFKHYFHGFVFIRIMQAFGAYGYLSAIKGKKHFLKSVPFAIRNLESLIAKDTILRELPVLHSIFKNLIEDQSLRKF